MTLGLDTVCVSLTIDNFLKTGDSPNSFIFVIKFANMTQVMVDGERVTFRKIQIFNFSQILHVRLMAITFTKKPFISTIYKF